MQKNHASRLLFDIYKYIYILKGEGCEYGVLNQLACNGGDSNFVKQIMVEFHWQKNLGIMSDDDIVIAGDAIRCLESERWGLVSLEQSGVDPAESFYIDSALKVVKNTFFALFATFRRVPKTEMMPYEAFREVMAASAEKEKVYAKYKPKYGGNISSWPDNGQKDWTRVVNIYNTKGKEYTSLYDKQPAKFDTFQRYERKLAR